MQSHVDCIVHRPVCSVGKLKKIQRGSSDVLQMGQHQFFKWLHDYRLGLHDILHAGDGDLLLITESSLLTRCAWLSHAKYRAALPQTLEPQASSPLIFYFFGMEMMVERLKHEVTSQWSSDLFFIPFLLPENLAHLIFTDLNCRCGERGVAGGVNG